MSWYRVLTCDGALCRPTNPESTGPLGGAFLRLPGTAPITLQRRTAASAGWVWDPVAKADLCPACQPHPGPAQPQT